MKKRLGGPLVAVALAVAPSAVQAGFTMGARVGLGIPVGELQGEAGGLPESQVDLNDVVALEAPSLNLHLGAAIGRSRFAIEGFLEFAPLVITEEMNDLCLLNDWDCSARNLRFGAMGSLRFTAQSSRVPWVGAGLGYEIFTVDQEARSYVYSGATFELMGGLDFRAEQGASWGPYASLQVGSFSDVEFESDLVGNDRWDPEAGLHGWLQLGIRGRIDFGG